MCWLETSHFMTFTIYDTKWTRLSCLILLLHVVLIKVTWWHSEGSWAGVENPRQLLLYIWCLGGEEWRARLYWASPLGFFIVFPHNVYSSEFKLQQLSCVEWVFQEARSRNCRSLWALTYKLAKHPFCHLNVLKQLWNLPIFKGENT